MSFLLKGLTFFLADVSRIGGGCAVASELNSAPPSALYPRSLRPSPSLALGGRGNPAPDSGGTCRSISIRACSEVRQLEKFVAHVRDSKQGQGQAKDAVLFLKYSNWKKSL